MTLPAPTHITADDEASPSVKKAPDPMRSTRARIAALALHAGRDSKKHLEPARAAFARKFELEVDPDGLLEPTERARRTQIKKREYFTRLALKSAVSRQRKARCRPKAA